jgi:hypothetical protein
MRHSLPLAGIKAQYKALRTASLLSGMITLNLLASPAHAAEKSAQDAPSGATGHHSDIPNTGDDGLRCPAGAVHIAEIRGILHPGGDAGQDQLLGAASVEVCANDPTKFSDIVIRGASTADTGVTSAGEKTGVNGTIQIRGRTAQMDSNIYAPISAADLAQCAQQQDSAPPTQDGSTQCKPHPFVASFSGTWVFGIGKWTNFHVGTDTAGNPITLMVRISNGPLE